MGGLVRRSAVSEAEAEISIEARSCQAVSQAVGNPSYLLNLYIVKTVIYTFLKAFIFLQRSLQDTSHYSAQLAILSRNLVKKKCSSLPVANPPVCQLNNHSQNNNRSCALCMAKQREEGVPMHLRARNVTAAQWDLHTIKNKLHIALDLQKILRL